jgi:hypothetical protein
MKQGITKRIKRNCVLKRIISLIAVATFLFSCLFPVACDNQEEKKLADNGVATPAKESSESLTESGFTWNDVPVYQGAKQVHRGDLAETMPQQADYSRVEWRYYETGSDQEDVALFYHSNMPGNGWEQIIWMDAGDTTIGTYVKNDEKDAAMVTIGVDNSKTYFGLVRTSN